MCCPVNDVIRKATRVNMTKTMCELFCLYIKKPNLKRGGGVDDKKIVSFIFQRTTMSRVLIMNLHSVRGEVRKFTRNWVFPRI